MVDTPEVNLSKAMRHLNGVYTQAFNRRHGQVGHVLQGRFKAIIVDRDNYLLELCRYVVLNLVRAKTTRKSDTYQWSSYQATAGLANTPPFLTVDWLLSQFGKQRTSAQRKYRTFVTDGIGQRSPWEQLQGQVLLGSDRFVRRMAPRLQEKHRLKEIPRRQRFATRPALHQLFGVRPCLDQTRRDAIICQAHLTYGYTLSEIGHVLGLHYSTISRLINAQGK